VLKLNTKLFSLNESNLIFEIASRVESPIIEYCEVVSASVMLKVVVEPEVEKILEIPNISIPKSEEEIAALVKVKFILLITPAIFNVFVPPAVSIFTSELIFLVESPDIVIESSVSENKTS
jgi:hypothetical protein